MPINFPDSPTVGDVFEVGSVSYKWTGAAWIANPAASLTNVSLTTPTIIDPTITVNGTAAYSTTDVGFMTWSNPGEIRISIYAPSGLPSIATVGSTIYMTGTAQNSLDIDDINFVIDTVDDFGIYVQIVAHAASAGDNTTVDTYLAGLTSNLSTVVLNKDVVYSISSELGYLDGVTSSIEARLAKILSSFQVNGDIQLESNKKYFVDTGSPHTLTLPATPAVGDEIQIFDAIGYAASGGNVTVDNNGNNINGTYDTALLNVNGFAAVFVWTGSTYGWKLR